MSYPFPQSLALSNLFAEVSSTGEITIMDRLTIRDTLLETQPSDEEKQAIDRLLYAIRTGRIRVLQQSESHV